MPQKMGAAKWVVCFLLFAWSVSAVAQKSVDWSRLYQQARPAVVAVFSLKDSQRHWGTGFFIGNDGKLVAAASLPRDMPLFVRRDDGAFLKVESVLRVDSLQQWSLLKVGVQRSPALRIAKRPMLKVGDAICIISTRPDGGGKLLAGNVSTMLTLPNKRVAWMVSMTLSEADYGAPVFNQAGEVVGIVVDDGTQNACVISVQAIYQRGSPPPAPAPPSVARPNPPASSSKSPSSAASPFVPLIRLARTIEDLPTRAQALLDIARYMPADEPLRLQTVREAESVAAKSQLAEEREYILGQVAQAWAEIGQPKPAMSALHALRDPLFRSQTACQLLAHASMAGEQETLLKQISHPYWRGRALVVLAATAHRAGKVEQALQWVQEAHQLSRSIEDGRWRASLLGEIACLMLHIAESGAASPGGETANEAASETPSLSEYLTQGEALLEETLRQIRAAPQLQSAVFPELIGFLVQYGFLARAHRLLPELSADQASEAQRLLALGEARAGNMEAATKLLQQVVEKEQRALAYAELVQVLCEQGHWQTAVELASNAPAGRARVRAHAYLAVSLAAAGKGNPPPQDAEPPPAEPPLPDRDALLARAEESATALSDSRWRPEAFAIVGWAHLHTGNRQKADEWFLQAVEVAKEAGEPYTSMSMERVLFWWARAVAETHPPLASKP